MAKDDYDSHLGPYLKQSDDELLQFAVLALDSIAQGIAGDNPQHMAVRAMLMLDDMAKKKAGGG